jgi:hypothetical protein
MAEARGMKIRTGQKTEAFVQKEGDDFVTRYHVKIADRITGEYRDLTDDEFTALADDSASKRARTAALRRIGYDGSDIKMKLVPPEDQPIIVGD